MAEEKAEDGNGTCVLKAPNHLFVTKILIKGAYYGSGYISKSKDTNNDYFLICTFLNIECLIHM